jgi:hypothetical protein
VEQHELVRFITTTLDRLSIPYMVVGSFASSAYGEARFTQDIDIVIEIDSGQLDALLNALPAEEFYVSREAALAAIRSAGQFNVIHPDSGNKVDFMIARRDAWGEEQLRRRVKLELLSGLEAYVARPEDVIISKMLYYQEGGSDKHLRDITGMLALSGDQIDRSYVGSWASQLGLEDVWKLILQRTDLKG